MVRGQTASQEEGGPQAPDSLCSLLGLQQDWFCECHRARSILSPTNAISSAVRVTAKNTLPEASPGLRFTGGAQEVAAPRLLSRLCDRTGGGPRLPRAGLGGPHQRLVCEGMS